MNIIHNGIILDAKATHGLKDNHLPMLQYTPIDSVLSESGSK
ncbi:MAG: hypothetical protein ABH886_09015 [Candidatus Desantisbacteria bacterium]